MAVLNGIFAKSIVNARLITLAIRDVRLKPVNQIGIEAQSQLLFLRGGRKGRAAHRSNRVVPVCYRPLDYGTETRRQTGSDVSMSGDDDLLLLNPFRGIAIVSPVTFVKGATRA
jgi:hypothetical protein